MKILKTRNLLTVILAVLCAVTVAIGISFVLPKTEKITAHASGSAADIKFINVQPHYLSVSTSAGGISGDYGVSQLTGPIFTGTTITTTDTLISIVEGTAHANAKVVYVDFEVSVEVPAWEEWEFSYDINFTFSANCSGGNTNTLNMSSGAYYFKPASSSNFTPSTNSSSLLFNKATNPSSGSLGGYGGYYCDGKHQQAFSYLHTVTIASKDPANANGTSNIVKYTNNTNQIKQLTFYYGMDFFIGSNSSYSSKMGSCKAQLQVSSFKTKELYVTPPKDVEIDYTGSNLKTAAAALIDATPWYTRTDATDDFTHTAGEWASYTLPSTIIDVKKTGGVLDGYIVTYALDDPTNHPFFVNGSFTTADQTFKIKVKPKTPSESELNSYLSVNAAGNALFAGQQLSTVSIAWDSGNTSIPADIKSGTVAWYSPSTTLQSGTNNYRYKFTSGSNNYNSVDNLNYSLTVGALAFDDIAVTYTQGSSKVFSTINLTDGTSLPGTLSVVKKDNGGGSMGTVALNQCTLSVTPGTTLTGGSTGSIRVTYTDPSNSKTVFKDITVNVSVPQLISITASQKPSTTIKESTSMQQLAQMLEVQAYYEDAPSTPKTLAFSDYTVTATLAVSSSCPVNVEVVDAGDNAVANWQSTTSGKCSTTVTVVASILVSIAAQWTGNVQPAPVYDRTPLNDLKPDLTVTATYDDGGTRTLTDAEYTLSGNITNVANGGSSVLTAEYGGKTAPVQLDNILKAQLQYVKVSYYDDTQHVLDIDDPDAIRDSGQVIVKAKYAQFTNEIIVTSDCTFSGNLVASGTDKSVIQIFFDGNEVDYDTYLYTNGTDSGLGVWVDAGNVTLLNKPTANTVLTYNGAEQTLVIANLDTAYMTVTGSVKQTTVGTYTVTISLIDPTSYRWDDRSKADVVINWEIKQLVLDPAISEQSYSGNEYSLKNILNLTAAEWDFLTSSGTLKKTDVGEYSATLTIKPEHFGNVVWSTSSIAPAKKTVRYALAAVSTSADCAVTWKIIPATVSATWDDSTQIPSLNLNSASVANVPSDLIVYTFKDMETGKTVPSNKLESGHDYEVTATLNTNDPRANNYAFTSPQPYVLSIPVSGPSFMQKVAGAMTKTVAGLPIWVWLLIGLAALLLLIIIIVVACKRRKSKEEKAEIKARKEEERQRKEEERQRLEEERRRKEEERLEEKRRREEERAEDKRRRDEQLEHEREMAKAKQEAELEKIRAQAQMQPAQPMQMPQPMAMPMQIPQQMPMQQQYQQPVQQPQPQYTQQPVNNNELAEIKKELKKLRAEQRAMRGSYPAAMPMQAQMYQQPQYGAAMAPSALDPNALAMAKIEAKLDNMHTEHSAINAARMEAEMAKMRADMYGNTMHSVTPTVSGGVPQMPYQSMYQQPAVAPATAPVQQPTSAPAQANAENNPTMLGEVLASMVRSLAAGQMAMQEAAATNEPQAVEETNTVSSQPVANTVPSQNIYPPDAVITTTTTVDTTKSTAKAPAKEEHDDRESFFDIDGFYDKFEG